MFIERLLILIDGSNIFTRGTSNGHADGWNYIEVSPECLIKLHTELLCDPAVPLLGMYRIELQICMCTKPCVQMFIAAAFITAKEWEQPKCPSLTVDKQNVVYCIIGCSGIKGSTDTCHNVNEL